MGDGYQNGGCLVVEAGGKKTLFTFAQESKIDKPESKSPIPAQVDTKPFAVFKTFKGYG